MTVVIPPQGFRHAVDLLLKNSVRKGRTDAEQLGRDLVALGDDMKASPEFGSWVIAEYERVMQQPAPAALAHLGHHRPRERERCDLFLIHVPEDRLPTAAPLAVELVKRRISVALNEYEIETDAQLTAAVSDGLNVHRAGAALMTEAFLRRQLHEPPPDVRLKILGQPGIPPTTQAETLLAWLSKIHTKMSARNG